MGKFFNLLVLTTVSSLSLFPIQSAWAEECPTYPDNLYTVSFEYTTFSGKKKQLNPEWGYPGGIGEIFSSGGFIYLQYSVGGVYGTQLSYVAYGLDPRIISIQPFEGDLPCYPNGKPPDEPNKPKKYFLWVDTFRGNKGILWGMFQGAPDGCTVVGAYIDGDNITRYKGNLNDSEVDFGYELIKSKEGYESPPIDFDKLPINYRDSKYEEYYFRANWVSPNCYWQVREVRRHSFGGVFDFLWSIFK